MHTRGRTRDFQCVLCHSNFSSKYGLQVHIQRHVKEEQHKCSHCNYTVCNVGSLRCHIRNVHQRLRIFTCSFPGCNYSTTHTSGFHRHIKRHDPDELVRRPVACNYPGCDYRTITRSSLKADTSSRHDSARKMEFACRLCTKAFHWKKSLMRHVKVDHLNEKAHTCNNCHYAASTLHELKLHQQRIHEKERKFRCKSCDYRAACKSDLNHHTRNQHSKKRRLNCTQPGCNYGTNYHTSFRRHLLTHEEDPKKRYPFTCAFPNCDFRRRISVGSGYQ